MFAPTSKTQVVCSDECRRERKRRHNHESWNRRCGAGTHLQELKRARDNRLRARDTEYAKLDVPVTTRVASNGCVIEVRGQPHYGSCCGTLGGMAAEVARKYL